MRDEKDIIQRLTEIQGLIGYRVGSGEKDNTELAQLRGEVLGLKFALGL